MASIVLVTGGSHVIATEPIGSQFGKKEGETWIFAKSSEADLSLCLVGGVYKNMKANSTFLRSNILINENILYHAHTHHVHKVISFLSSCVFPDKVEYPLDETKIHLGLPHPSNFGYSHSKRLVDIQNRAYREEFGCNFTSAIPTSVFGPNDNYDLEDAHVIPALIHRCYLAKKNNKPFVVAGTGKPLRQFIYSRDLAKLVIWMLREYDDVDPVILSVSEDEEITVKQVADAIVKAMEFNGTYTFDTSRPEGQFRKPASNKKLLSLIGEFEFTPFEIALKQSVDWFLENYDNARIGQPFT
ncbi:NAD(P)-binding protein [Gymnopus androsaceus JB14]|uniref:NAD(P)-binding protein n=1 Tax=Gymnopus androsaceus JB14 TaxID=1447944 RepID=A0A6A4GDQ7_9AGAR|nr:NAD(P)-binding protein [Gymnopus androsaceus JB14]